jgi:Reverse transcriptase (RNA-dependent DNA polymerase)
MIAWTDIHQYSDGISMYREIFLLHGCEIRNRTNFFPTTDRFDMKDMGIASRFLGMEIEYGKDGSIKVHQNRYIQQLLERHGMQDGNPVTTPMDTSVKLTKRAGEDVQADPKEYASIVGGLMFAACVTRPDIMCAVGQLSQFLNDPSSKHLLAAKRVLRYFQGTSSYGITYRPPPLRLQGYSDADWAGDLDTRRSTTGYIVMLNNGAIVWQSRRQPTVALHCPRWSRNIWLSQKPPKS